MSRYLLSSSKELLSSLRDKRLSFFLDFDGTLSPIAARPQDARLSQDMKDLLKSLAVAFPAAIVSGRSLRDLESHAGLPCLAYAGNHGLEIDSPDFSMLFDAGPEIRHELSSLSRSLSELSRRFPGSILEDKGLSLSLHYRLLDMALFNEFEKGFSEITSGALDSGKVYLAKSKMAFEIKANVAWDKGRAVLWMLERPRFSGTTPIYIGDDETDMDAYRALGPKGISVHVGHAIEEARYHLLAQTEVKVSLEMLLNSSQAERVSR